MLIEIRRIYDRTEDVIKPYRILVDRIWPRGVSKKVAKLDFWFKEIAPSHELRKWFNHDPKKFVDFCRKYHKELDKKSQLVNQIIQLAEERKILLLFSAKDREHNQAKALALYLSKSMDRLNHP
ncbi:MAG: DUF488 family protein [Saprospiraceae bacterium]|nr:DUF488 family protein [Saprospiraceae bacterium]